MSARFRLRRLPLIILHSFSFIFFFPSLIQAAQATQDVEIFVSCVEDLGDGRYLAHFGYENPNDFTIEVQGKKSFVAYNYTRKVKYVVNSFEPGLHERAFSEEFVADDWVRWTVKFGPQNDKVARADQHSAICVAELPIIPYYQPPEGGKTLNSKIGAELTSLNAFYAADPIGFAAETDFIFQLDGSLVFIELVAAGSYADMMTGVLALGFIEVTADPDLGRATGWFGIGDLLLLNEVVPLNYARPVYPGIGNYVVPATGLVNSQGDVAMRSDFARLGFGIDGSGVKIGVLSNSYNTRNKAAEDVANGDLPGAANPNGYGSEVQVLLDAGSGYGTLSDEGRAMLQIVHDIAPGAHLAFRTGYLGEQDMADGIRQLADSGCDVIVDDLTYITEPFFRDGVISQMIDEVVGEGVVFFSSAGNFGNASYSSDLSLINGPAGLDGQVHDFGGGDFLQQVELPVGTYTMVLQWDDGSHPEMATTTTDLDLFLTDDDATTFLGFNRENVGGFPIEVIPFSIEGETVLSNIIVSRASGPDVPVKFKYIVFRGGSQFSMLEHVQGTSTIVGHPNAAGAIAVGAVRYDKNPVYSPDSYTEPVIMSFSSIGGTPVNGVLRQKPDISAPNGVNTTVDLGSGDWDGDADAFPNFFGTSAASPHAAAVAALIMEARARFAPSSPLGPEGIRSLMQSTAMEMGEPGADLVSGYGFIRADLAIMSFANPSPVVENLIPDPGGPVPGESLDSISFTLEGDYFTDQTQVLLRGDELGEGVVVSDEQTISVDHPGFLGNPLVQAYTPSISESGLDGGFSDSVFFSDPITQKIVIKASDATKLYGEAMPEFSASITLITSGDDTLSLAEAVDSAFVSPEEAGRLSTLAFSTPADVGGDAGQYIVQPAIDPLYDPDAPGSELDFALSEKFRLEYVNASLIIDKLPLLITPGDLTLTYGDVLEDGAITFEYQLGDSTTVLADPELVLTQVAEEHTAALTNGVSLVRGIALVNGIPVVRGSALVNGVRLIRGSALVNGVEVQVELSASDTTVFIDGVPLANAGSLVRGLALVNGLPFVNMTQIVRGTALVNGNELTIDEGYITELNGEVLENGVPAVRGLALVNGQAIVNGHELLADSSGATTIDGMPVPADGVAVVNGVTFIRGTALVNAGSIIRGSALVNELELAIENGLPSVRGLALVNGIPLTRGLALVNNLEVEVIDGEVVEVREDGAPISGLSLENGIGFIRGTALVNGSSLIRGTALVNGLAVVNGEDFSSDVVNLENMNMMASTNALLNGVPLIRGSALVNGLESMDAGALKVAAGTVQEDGSIVYENAVTGLRGLALVNGSAFVRGTALVNGVLVNNGSPIVNSSTVNDSTNSGTILVFDARDLGSDTLTPSLEPISFITGTDAGQHWIVPGTYISNNYEIEYGLGKLTILKAEASLTADPKVKAYGTTDPELSYQASALEGEDQWSGSLTRDLGEDVGSYLIRQGSLDAGDNYFVQYSPAELRIDPARLLIEASAADKVYDGSAAAIISLSDDRLNGDELLISYDTAYFEDKHAGLDKPVFIEGILLNGSDAPNYIADSALVAKAGIQARALLLEGSAEHKVYDGTVAAAVTLSDDRLTGDVLNITYASAQFDSKHAGVDKPVSVEGISLSGVDAHNYLANSSLSTRANIAPRMLLVEATASDKTYDGNQYVDISLSDDRLNGDELLISYDTAYFEDKHAGLDKPVFIEGILPGGADALNYRADTNLLTSASISPKMVYVYPAQPSYTIYKQEVLPEIIFTYDGWIEGDTGNDGYVVERDTDGAPYDQSSLFSAGTYLLIPTPLNDDYLFEVTPGTLFVLNHCDDDGDNGECDDDELDDSVGSSGSDASGPSAEPVPSEAQASMGFNSHEPVKEVLKNAVQIMVYPNPFTDLVYLSSEEPVEADKVRVYDLSGRSYSVPSSIVGSSRLELDMSQLLPGSYLIQVVSRDEVKILQVIKK